MPTLPIPLFTKSYKNADGTVLTDDAAIQYNGFIDELQGLNVRPGEVLAKNTGTRNDGLFMWPDVNMIVCVDNSVVTLRTVSGQTLVDFATPGTITSIIGAQLATFCSSLEISTGAYYVFIAAGGKINYVKYLSGIADPVVEMADADAPTTVTHVAFLDGYILAISGNRLYFSNNPNNISWDALDFASAEANPDTIQAMHVIQRQIYLLGTVSTEIWENDGATPFSRIPGGLMEVGCGAKYSVIRHDNSLIWLSHTRQFVQFSGIDVKYISSRYDNEIANFTTVSDCIGGSIRKGGQEYYVFQFPTENRTLAYNPAIEDWSEWGVWDSSSASWKAYDFRATARDINTGQVFVGKSTARAIACLDSNSRVDLASPTTTTPFKFLRQTGFIDHGISKKKRVENLCFRAKRGDSSRIAYASGVPANGKIILTTELLYFDKSVSHVLRYGLGKVNGTYDYAVPPPDQNYWGSSSYFFNTAVVAHGLAIWIDYPGASYNPASPYWSVSEFSDVLAEMIRLCDWVWLYDPYYSFYHADGSSQIATTFIDAINALRRDLTPTLQGLIEYGTDYTPAQYADQTTFDLTQSGALDGSIVKILTNDGTEFSTRGWGVDRFELSDLSDSLEYFATRNRLGWGYLKKNFVKWQIGNSTSTIIDWFSSGIDILIDNFRVLAEFAAQAGFSGIWFDNEGYLPVWTYDSLPLRGSYTLAQYQARVYQVGKIVAQNVRSASTDLNIMVIDAYDGYAGRLPDVAGSEWGLWKDFLDGMLDGFGETLYTAVNPKLMLRYRNDGNSEWSNIKEIDLGATGQTNHHIELNRLGMYKSRQYELSATDNVPLVLSNATIDITVLR